MASQDKIRSATVNSAKGAHGMSQSVILQGKRAVVFGGAGSIGAAVAKAFASEGAEVFLAGRSATSVQAVAKEIEAAGGWAHAAVIDALDGAAVEAYLESVVGQTGGLDIEFNATGPRASAYANGKLAVDVPLDEFMVPVETVLKAQFLTARAAARQMLKQGSGVIIFLTGSPSRPHDRHGEGGRLPRFRPGGHDDGDGPQRIGRGGSVLGDERRSAWRKVMRAGSAGSLRHGKSSGWRQGRVRGPRRAGPGRAEGALLPDAGHPAGRGGRPAGDAAGCLEGTAALGGWSVLPAGLALRDRDQPLPERAALARPPT